MTKCFDEGTLQAFLDNELDETTALFVTRHVAACDACAELMATVEEETALVFGALEPELNTLVPTQRLWTKINESIAGERRTGWLGSLRGLFRNLSMPSVAAFGSIAIVAGTFAVFLSMQGDAPQLGITARSVPVSLADSQPSREVADTVTAPVETDDQVRAVNADFRTAAPRRVAVVPTAPRPKFLDGEEAYLRTITKLERSVAGNKDALLSATARFNYEKDLAVVNDSIDRTRREIRRNPNSPIAKQVLFNSYQTKIELLNSVSERSELIASVTR